MFDSQCDIRQFLDNLLQCAPPPATQEAIRDCVLSTFVKLAKKVKVDSFDQKHPGLLLIPNVNGMNVCYMNAIIQAVMVSGLGDSHSEHAAWQRCVDYYRYCVAGKVSLARAGLISLFARIALGIGEDTSGYTFEHQPLCLSDRSLDGIIGSYVSTRLKVKVVTRCVAGCKSVCPYDQHTIQLRPRFLRTATQLQEVCMCACA